MFKKVFVLLSVLAVGLSSCSKWGNNNGNQDILFVKYISSIEGGDGSMINFEYDTANRVSRIICSGNESEKVFDVKYDRQTIEVSNGVDNWIMRFNSFSSLESWSSVVGMSETKLSTFSYVINGYGYVFLAGIKRLSDSAESTVNWEGYCPMRQTNRWTDNAGAANITYSTAIEYRYESLYSNIHANVNLFLILVPEFFEYAEIDNILAAGVSVFGTRVRYLPTKVSIKKTRSEVDHVETISEVEHVFSYDTDADGYVKTIYSGSGDDRTMLYDIKYFSASAE